MGVFGYFYGDEYREFYLQQKQYSYQQEILAEKLSGFSIDEVVPLEHVKIQTTPSKDVLDVVVQKIDVAEKRVYLEVYIFTEKRIFQALKRAKNRGIDVRVILEKNPYKAPRLNDTRYDELEHIGIPVVWSSPDNYALNHTKMLIVDDEVVISTGNMSYSTFTKNRDFLVFVKDIHMLQVFEEVFHGDFKWQKVLPYHENIVLSPFYSRQKLSVLIDSAQTSIDMYFQYLKDDALREHVIKKALEWVKIRIVLDDDYMREHVDEVQELRSYGIEIDEYDSSVMHAKAILVDSEVLFIGSINFSNYSLDKNREVWILIRDTHVISDFQEVFDSDF